jgi:hypothetical protein
VTFERGVGSTFRPSISPAAGVTDTGRCPGMHALNSRDAPLAPQPPPRPQFLRGYCHRTALHECSKRAPSQAPKHNFCALESPFAVFPGTMTTPYLRYRRTHCTLAADRASTKDVKYRPPQVCLLHSISAKSANVLCYLVFTATRGGAVVELLRVVFRNAVTHMAPHDGLSAIELSTGGVPL